MDGYTQLSMAMVNLDGVRHGLDSLSKELGGVLTPFLHDTPSDPACMLDALNSEVTFKERLELLKNRFEALITEWDYASKQHAEACDKRKRETIEFCKKYPRLLKKD